MRSILLSTSRRRLQANGSDATTQRTSKDASRSSTTKCPDVQKCHACYVFLLFFATSADAASERSLRFRPAFRRSRSTKTGRKKHTRRVGRASAVEQQNRSKMEPKSSQNRSKLASRAARRANFDDFRATRKTAREQIEAARASKTVREAIRGPERFAGEQVAAKAPVVTLLLIVL